MKKIILISNFHLGIFSGILKKTLKNFNIEITENSMAGVETIHMLKSEGGKNQSVFIWMNPNIISPTFNKALMNELIESKDALNEIELFLDMVVECCSSYSSVILPTFHLQNSDRHYGILEMRKNLGVRNLILEMNRLMIEKFNNHQNFIVLDSSLWFQDSDAYSSKMWYSAKVPFGNSVFNYAAKDVKAVQTAIKGNAKKLIICDLDNTLWGGVVGDVGWRNIRLGGHDHIGEAFVDFQQKLKALHNKGIVLSICSKNTESVAIEAIEKNPEMVLRKEDFSTWKINWDDKAKNIISICEELNLGLNSAVFIDDSVHERERVKDALPDVVVPDLPEDPRLYPSIIASMNYFDSISITDEDISRNKMYQNRKKEDKAKLNKQKFKSPEEWLLSLKIKVLAEKLNDTNHIRTTQLINKTNQMNLSTRRLTDIELKNWTDKAENFLWTFRVSDKFGASGLTGIASFTLKGDEAIIVDFILSCRVMGKNIEHAMTSFLVQKAKALKVKSIIVKYQKTEKNKPCYDYWKSSNFIEKNKSTFVWDLDKEYLKQKSIELNEVQPS